MHRSKKSLAVVVAALLIAGTGVAKAADLLGAANRTAAVDRPANAAGHRFVFEDGKPRYEGEALRTTGLLAHLNEAKQAKASGRAAFEARALDSLVAAGLPPEVADAIGRRTGTDPKVGPWLAPAGDLDADGKPDLIAQTVRWVDGGQDVLQVAGVKGTDGSLLWDRHFRGYIAGAVPAVVNGAGGVLVFEHNANGTGADADVAWAGAVDVSLTVTALDAGGATAWTRTFSGAFQEALAFAYVAYGYVVRLDTYPVLAGVLDADGDGNTDVLMSIASGVYQCSGVCIAAITVDAVAVRGDGTTTGPVSRSSTTSEPVLYAAPDLAGAGHDHALFLTEEDGNGLHVDAIDLAASTSLWSTTVAEAAYPEPIAVGDINQDGGVDIVAWSPYSFYGEPQSVLGGKDGAVLWARPMGLPFALNGAVGLVETFNDFEHDTMGVTYAAVDGAGNTQYERSYAVPRSYEAEFEVYPDLGDLDGDGVSDSAHKMVVADFDTQSFVTEAGAVSGRTGDKLWNGTPGRSLKGGPGPRDMAAVSLDDGVVKLTRIAGASGLPRWSAETPGNTYASPFGHDVTGDGMADVALSAGTRDYDGDDYESYFSVDGEPVVFDGVTGQRLWTLSDLPEGSQRARTETKPYVAPPPWLSGPLPGGNEDCTGDGVSTSGTCFDVDSSDRTVSISIDDDNTAHVAGLYRLIDKATMYYAEAYFCDSVSLDVPPGTELAYVFALTRPVPECPDALPATTGTIQASFA